MLNIYENVDRNKRNSLFTVVAFTVFVVGVTYIMARGLDVGLGYVGIALIFSGISGFVSYYFSDKIILGISGARPADRNRDFNFYTVTENLSLAAQMPMPKLYVIDDTAMNAFATGRDPQHAVVCATTGILAKLSRTELEGVIAHELSHVRNYDIRLMSIVTVLVGMIALLADMFLRISARAGRGKKGGEAQLIFLVAGLVLAILSPIAAKLIQLAISRRREFLADASGAALTKYPEGLAKALEKLAADHEPLEAANKATAHLYITNPLKNVQGGVSLFANWFNTHPPIQERINALRGKE